jgi:hypothetical protein
MEAMTLRNEFDFSEEVVATRWEQMQVGKAAAVDGDVVQIPEMNVRQVLVQDSLDLEIGSSPSRQIK